MGEDMGIIREEVKSNLLNDSRESWGFLNVFLINGFDVTWGKKVYTHNTTLYLFFLLPEEHIRESYGFEREILLAFSTYDKLEPRTIQSIYYHLDMVPAKGRVDNITYFLVSQDPNVEEWIKNYRTDNADSKICVPFNYQELCYCIADPWYIRNTLGRLFYGRDLYEYALPLTSDKYFFGRQQFCANYLDAIKRSENKGIFGLRKTGKTSLLFKLRRMIDSEKVGYCIYLDCKLPQIRNLSWKGLFNKICALIIEQIPEMQSIPFNNDGDEKFLECINAYMKTRKKEKIVLCFDEIEFISFYAKLNEHWRREFTDFWQTIWSIQSETKAFSFIITGVNPNVVEESIVNGVQNPLFGIVSYEYLTGLNVDDLKLMITKIGKRMGMDYEYDCLIYLYKRYGGHPLLTRMACSLTNKKIQYQNCSRPYWIKNEYLIKDQDLRDEELSYYCGHIVSELFEFYRDEYDMLEYLAIGMMNDFIELAQNSQYIKHLKSYGLLSYNDIQQPEIAIPVLGSYLRKELARKNKRKDLIYIVPEEDRELWLERRKDSIIQDVRLFERLILEKNIPCLFGCNSFYDADKFIKSKVVKDKDQFSVFINMMFKCFYESIENYGKQQQKRKYIHEEIRCNYPAFYRFLERINAYRNEQDHVLLTFIANKKLAEYLEEDFLGQSLTTISEPYFALQQKCLDALLVSIQIEISKLL